MEVQQRFEKKVFRRFFTKPIFKTPLLYHRAVFLLAGKRTFPLFE
jgi:hypothetical protein